MARPKKDAAGMNARQRIIESFWQILTVCRLDELSIERVSEGAACNRGSFYYHFASIEDLVDAAIDELLTNSENIPGRLFVLTTGAHTVSEVFGGHSVSVARLSLLLRRGGYGLIENRIVSYIEDIWAKVLCDEGKSLNEESSFIISYMVGALLGIIERYGNALDRASVLEGLFMSEASGVALRNLSIAEGLTFEEALGRLRSLKRVERMASMRPQHIVRDRD